MKKIFTLFAVLFAVHPLFAQTNAPARLALISETDDAAPIADLLTEQLSGNQKVQLLERDQIEKVYREQALSVVNNDYLKLGQLLGADGLLLLEMAKEGTNQFLNVRLLAVKPGVVLSAEKFPWTPDGLTEWSSAFAKRLDLFLPKLTVLPKDAIPISVVNLRSAIASADAAETERQLKLLTIQRLSQERQFFVLERQKMSLLNDEKDLKADDSAFWDGSYLLEGIVDQNGFSESTITLNARLTPPRGGAPILLAASGSRTNLAEVINQLVAQINGALKINSTTPAWNAADEAAQYFAEANWAMRWGVFPEAQAAADSAWALGKHDPDCAMLRVHAYMVSPDAGATAIYYPPQKKPDPQNITSALRALELYNESCRNLPPDEPKVDSAWYRLGLENLTVASRVLQVFNWSPDFYQPVAEKLAELRAVTRSTAALISQSPSVHDSYFVGDRLATYDELDHFGETASIFSLKLDCGCLWQDTPEDSLALYRELMGSPVFCYLHDNFWFRNTIRGRDLRMLPPRLIAWNEANQKRIPMVWNHFMQELDTSTNLFWNLEAKAIRLAEATNDMEMTGAFTNFFNAVLENRDQLVANPVDVLYVNWRAGDLVEYMGGGIYTPAKESLRSFYYSTYNSKLEAMHKEYQNKTAPARQTADVFKKQKHYLASFEPYSAPTFVQMFDSRNYTKAQAAELRPLITIYQSNLLAQATTKNGKFFAQANAQWIELYLGKAINEILNPPAPAKTQTLRPISAVQVTAPVLVATKTPDIVTNILAVKKFLAIPLAGLPGDEINSNDVKIVAHHWFAGKLLLNFEYGAYLYSFDKSGAWQSTRGVDLPGIALLDSATEQWNVISCPEATIESQNNFYHHSTLFHGDVFDCNGGQIRKYDAPTQQWEVLTISDGNNYELFTVNENLYAANQNLIFEILDGGKNSQILASTRRQPPITTLDTHGLGTPILFTGPDHSLRVIAGDKIYSWTGSDWREECAAPPVSSAPEIFTDGILYRHAEWSRPPLTLTFFATEATAPELYLWQKSKGPTTSINYNNRLAEPPVPPIWQMPTQWFFAGLAAGICESNLYLLADYSDAADSAKNICDSTLLCFSRGVSSPQKILLKFGAPEGHPPLTGIDPTTPTYFPGSPTTWMVATTNFILFGSEHLRYTPDYGNHQNVRGHQTGVWLLPTAQIAPAIAEQKAAQLAHANTERVQATAALADAKQAAKNLFAKYDLNHNGVIDPGERAAALADPAFIALELKAIDANNNGWLDASELVYFDANQNKILEPKAQAGIEITQHLFAERLLKKFDKDGGGALDRSEYDQLRQTLFDIKTRPVMGGLGNRNNEKFDLSEIESLLKQQTHKGLRLGGAGGAAVISQMRSDANGAINPQQLFKLEVETYWRNQTPP